MEDFADAISRDAGVDLHQLPALTSLLVWTRNSSYRIIVIEGANISVQGGTSFPEATQACLAGARLGRGVLMVGWIAVGLSMEIRVGRRRIVTSPVRSISTDPSRGQTTQ